MQPGAADIPRANAHVRSTTVVLPQSLLLNPALAARLDACTDAQFALRDTSVAARCPPSSAVGDIDFVSPILGSFPGRAYFGNSAPGDRLRLFLDVPLYGAHIKVSAHVRPSTTTGQITTIFDELPQIAFTDFKLTFKGGPRSALVSPTECGAHTASAVDDAVVRHAAAVLGRQLHRLVGRQRRALPADLPAVDDHRRLEGAGAAARPTSRSSRTGPTATSRSAA